MPAAELPRQHPSRLISSSSPKPRQLPAGASLTSRTPCQNPFCVSRRLLFFAWCKLPLWLFPLSSSGMPRTGHGKEDAVSDSPCRVLSWSCWFSRRCPVAVGQLRPAFLSGDGVVEYQVVDVVVQRRRVFYLPQDRPLRLLCGAVCLFTPGIGSGRPSASLFGRSFLRCRALCSVRPVLCRYSRPRCRC